MSVVGLFVQERVLPIFGNTLPAIYHYQFAELYLPALTANILGLCLAVEGYNIVNGWSSIDQTFNNPKSSGLAYLKDDYIPGDLNFDPLGILPIDNIRYKRVQTKELNNGRLAMIATAVIVIQEIVSGKPMFG